MTKIPLKPKNYQNTLETGKMAEIPLKKKETKIPQKSKNY